MKKHTGIKSDWTQEQDTLLRNIYPTSGADACMKAIGRDKKVIQNRAYYLGVKLANTRTNWTKEMDDLLTRVYQTHGMDKTIEALGLKRIQISRRAYLLGVKPPNANLVWTKEMDAQLSDVYPKKGKLAAMEAMGLSEGQVRSRAHFLKLKARGVSDISILTQKLNGEKRRGIKRPEHAALMREMTKAGRVLNYERTDQRRAEMSAMAKKMIAEKGHPRGALGMKHSSSAKEKISRASIKCWVSKTEEQVADMVYKAAKTRDANGTKIRQRIETTWKAAWREFGGRRVFYRSRWEANYGRYLEWLKSHGHIKEWEHEPKTFWFDGIKRGCVSYLPDFRVTENNGDEAYHEVKGWMDDRSKTKIARMARYHPQVLLIVIAKKEYSEIEKKMSALIDGWEYSK